MKKEPGFLVKLFFWIILGVLSVAFAEITTGSQLFPFFTPAGWFVVFPVYFFHMVLFSTWVFKFSKPRIWTLYVAGMIFGMYEAYITKVLWNSYTPDGPPIVFGGVAVIETVVLVLVVHSIFAFVLPLFFAENILTKSRDINKGLSDKWKKKIGRHGLFWGILLMGYLGFTQTSPSFLHSFGAGIGATLFIIFLVFLWRKTTNGLNYTMSELLPSKKGFFVFLVLTLLLYFIFTTNFDAEKLPSIDGQIGILVLYLFLFILFFASLRKSRRVELGKYAEPSVSFSFGLVFVFGLVFTLVSVFGNLFLSGLAVQKFLFIGLLYFLIGFAFLFKTIMDVFRKS